MEEFIYQASCFYNVLDVLPNLFLEVLVRFLLPKQSQPGQTWLQNRSKFNANYVQNRSWAVLGATLEKPSKNGSRALILWGALGAKLASLGAQDGATDGQVGGTWGPKRRRQGQNHRSKNWSFFRCLLKSIFFEFGWILGTKMEASWHQNRMENQC